MLRTEAVPRASIPVLAAARRLWSIGQLETTQVKCVLKGFTKCLVLMLRDLLKNEINEDQMRSSKIDPRVRSVLGTHLTKSKHLALR